MEDPVPVRAHLLLCLLGFRGEGYSEDFVAQMGALADQLQREPGTRIRLAHEPDPICGACPNLGPQGCTLGGPGHESHIRDQDLDVLARLGLESGSVHPWAELRGRIAERVSSRDLPAICTTCPWLPLGYCQEGLDGLREGPSGSP